MKTEFHPTTPKPDCLPQFETVNRYWDKVQKSWAAKILPGEYYVTRDPNEIVATTLGSCVSACIRDKVFGIGGMNHFMLPMQSQYDSDHWMGAATRYGTYAMEHLINDIINAGGHRKNLEVKLTGGGNVMSNMSNVGERNIDFVLKFLDVENIDVLVTDLGDVFPRKVLYYPATGRLRVKKLRNVSNNTLIMREQQYQAQVESEADNSGGVELF